MRHTCSLGLSKGNDVKSLRAEAIPRFPHHKDALGASGTLSSAGPRATPRHTVEGQRNLSRGETLTTARKKKSFLKEEKPRLLSASLDA